MEDLLLAGNEKEDKERLVEAFRKVIDDAGIDAKAITSVTLDNVDLNKAFVDALRKIPGFKHVELSACFLHIVAIGMGSAIVHGGRGAWSNEGY